MTLLFVKRRNQGILLPFDKQKVSSFGKIQFPEIGMVFQIPNDAKLVLARPRGFLGRVRTQIELISDYASSPMS